MKDASLLSQWARFPDPVGFEYHTKPIYITLSLSTYLSSLVRPSVRPPHPFCRTNDHHDPISIKPLQETRLISRCNTHSLQPFVGGGTKAAMLCYILYASTYSLLRGQPVSQSGLFPDLHFTTSPASSAFHSYSYYLLYPPPINILSDFPPSPPRLGKEDQKNRKKPQVVWIVRYSKEWRGEKKKRKWVYKKKSKKEEKE